MLRELAGARYDATAVLEIGVVPDRGARIDALLPLPVREAALVEALEHPLRARGHLVADGALAEWDF